VLGPIDSDSEAVLLAQLSGLWLACAAPSFTPNVAPGYGTQVQTTAAGYRVKSVFGSCGGIDGTQQLEVRRDGTVGAFEKNELKRNACAIGRRPEGLVLNAPAGCEPLARLLAECAQLEAASVPAFLRLARELQGLGAHGLAHAARISAQDEVRHTRQMQRLAARYDGQPSKPQVQRPARSRGAYEIARDNAVEGCVRETFGALLAWQQAATARDPEVAKTMREIAADETRHAELSWEIAQWLEPQLAAHERAAVDAARGQALAQLSKEIAADSLPDEARAQIGWPSAAQQHALLQRMATELTLS
jgi:rubrerythrin